jgi:hypothetical protein
MKKLFTISLLTLLMGISSFAQNMGVNTTTPHATAMLDVVSNNKGFLPPRMSAAARDSIVSPAAGLIIYCTTSNCLNFFNGTDWVELCGSLAPSAFVCGATFIDQRDGKSYPSVSIGGNSMHLAVKQIQVRIIQTQLEDTIYGQMHYKAHQHLH